MNFTARVTSRAFEVGRAPSIRRSLRIAALGVTSVALSALFVFPASLPAAAEPPLTVAEARVDQAVGKRCRWATSNTRMSEQVTKAARN